MQELRTEISGHSIVRFRSGKRLRTDDYLAIEEPLQLQCSYAGRTHNLAITMRTPGCDVALATGFLFTEGFLPPNLALKAGPSTTESRLADPSQVDANTLCIEWPLPDPPDLKRVERSVYTSSSCGVCGKTSVASVYATVPFAECPSRTTVSHKIISALPPKLRRAQEVFARTGGIHAAGLFTPTGELLHHAEDVGRHNALDKLIGHYYLRQELPLQDHLLLLSGRASFELIQKAAMAGIPIVASVGAPSSLAVALAEDQGITLVGFVRDTGFNCYTHPHRITD